MLVGKVLTYIKMSSVVQCQYDPVCSPDFIEFYNYRNHFLIKLRYCENNWSVFEVHRTFIKLH